MAAPTKSTGEPEEQRGTKWNQPSVSRDPKKTSAAQRLPPHQPLLLILPSCFLTRVRPNLPWRSPGQASGNGIRPEPPHAAPLGRLQCPAKVHFHRRRRLFPLPRPLLRQTAGPYSDLQLYGHNASERERERGASPDSKTGTQRAVFTRSHRKYGPRKLTFFLFFPKKIFFHNCSNRTGQINRTSRLTLNGILKDI